MTEKKIFISVIIPTYKPAGYLCDCLQSIYNQSLNKSLYEIIIVLNGCNEPYRSQVSQYIDKYLNEAIVNLFQIDKGGVSNARNFGIDHSKGDFIVFVDDDDLISQTYLNDLLLVSNKNCVGCSNSFSFVDSIDKKNNNFITDAYNRNINKKFSIYSFRQFLSPPWCKMIHKDIIGENRFPTSLKKSEDSVFCLKLTTNINQMRLTNPSAIYYQRKRIGSATRNRTFLIEEIKELFKIEYLYFSFWGNNFRKCNVLFMISRVFAALRNFYRRIQTL